MASVLFPSFCPAVPSPLLGVHNTFFKDKWDFFFFCNSCSEVHSREKTENLVPGVGAGGGHTVCRV